MAETLYLIGLLVFGGFVLGRWLYQNVWIPPKVLYGTVVEKTYEKNSSALPPVFPGADGVYQAGTTNILVLEIEGVRHRFTAGDETWKRVNVEDRIKAWIQADSHISGVYVVARSPQQQG